mgnify:FL=1
MITLSAFREFQLQIAELLKSGFESLGLVKRHRAKTT